MINLLAHMNVSFNYKLTRFLFGHFCHFVTTCINQIQLELHRKPYWVSSLAKVWSKNLLVLQLWFTQPNTHSLLSCLKATELIIQNLIFHVSPSLSSKFFTFSECNFFPLTALSIQPPVLTLRTILIILTRNISINIFNKVLVTSWRWILSNQWWTNCKFILVVLGYHSP